MRGTRTTIAGIVCHQVNHGAAPQWEPRKPLAGIHAAMRADEMLERVMWRAMRSGSGW